MSMTSLMSEDQKYNYACASKELSFEHSIKSSSRGSQLSDEFTRLEVQIATIVFAFASLFLDSFSNLYGYSFLKATLMKLTYVTSIFFLLISLILGLLHIKRKELFWDNAMYKSMARFREWDKVIRKEASFEDGRAFHKGIAVDDALVIKSPSWTWILQTTFLGVGITLLFILFVVILFS